VIGLVGGTVSAAARRTGHLVSFCVTLTMMIAMLAYTIYSLRNRAPPHCNKYDPLYFVIASVPLVMADLTRHLILDHVSVHWLLEYRKGCGHETVVCLTVVGVIFTIVCTYLGFLCLFIGSLWNANICEKIRELRAKWRELRREAEGDAAPGALLAVGSGPTGMDPQAPDAPFDADTFVAAPDPYANTPLVIVAPPLESVDTNNTALSAATTAPA